MCLFPEASFYQRTQEELGVALGGLGQRHSLGAWSLFQTDFSDQSTEVEAPRRVHLPLG